MSVFKKTGFIILPLLCFVYAAIGQNMTFTGQISKQAIAKNEQLQVSFVVSNAGGSVSFSGPTFKDFTVLYGPNQSRSSTYSDINGKVSRNESVTYTYVLLPKKTGVLTIEPASVSVGNNRLATSSIKIQVSDRPLPPKTSRAPQPQYNNDPFADFDDMDQMMEEMIRRQRQIMQQMQQQAQQARPSLNIGNVKDLTADHLKENVFIIAHVDNKNPYVGQQINVVYKLYTRLNMTASMTDMPSLNGFWSQDVKLPPNNTPVQENYNGKIYNVFTLKKTALFPQQTGRLLLDAAKAEGVVEVAEKVGATPWGDQYAAKRMEVKLSSSPVTINVKPLPQTGKPVTFNGAVGNFKIQAVLDSNSISTDDIAQLTLRITGSGNLKLIGAPSLNLPEGLNAVDPEISDSVLSLIPNVSGYKQFVYNISPDAVGNYMIPGVAFSYFDISSGNYKTITSSPFNLTVKQGKNVKPILAEKNADIKDIQGLIKRTPQFNAVADSVVQQWYYWLAYALPALFLIIVLLMQKRSDKISQNAALFKHKRANKVAWKRLATARGALKNTDHTIFYEEISKAVWLYLSDKLSIPLSSLSKENIAQQLRFKQLDEKLVERTHELITECEMALYSPSGGQHQKQQTLDEAATLIGDFEDTFKKKKNA